MQLLKNLNLNLLLWTCLQFYIVEKSPLRIKYLHVSVYIFSTTFSWQIITFDQFYFLVRLTKVESTNRAETSPSHTCTVYNTHCTNTKEKTRPGGNMEETKCHKHRIWVLYFPWHVIHMGKFQQVSVGKLACQFFKSPCQGKTCHVSSYSTHGQIMLVKLKFAKENLLLLTTLTLTWNFFSLIPDHVIFKERFPWMLHLTATVYVSPHPIYLLKFYFVIVSCF